MYFHYTSIGKEIDGIYAEVSEQLSVNIHIRNKYIELAISMENSKL